ncbi:UNVERIFIED_CONTAM: hypothetical protein FKN15_034492 [Acipenser sinensis]
MHIPRIRRAHYVHYNVFKGGGNNRQWNQRGRAHSTQCYSLAVWACGYISRHISMKTYPIELSQYPFPCLVISEVPHKRDIIHQ